MSNGDRTSDVRIYSTAPQSRDCTQSEYLLKLADAARWSERYGCRGILIDAGDSLCEPWILASVVLQNTTTLHPLVTLRPESMPPFSAAKTISTYAFLYRRRFGVRMVADDHSPESAERLREYTSVMRKFLECSHAVTFEGQHYSIVDQEFAPPLPGTLMPEILIGAEHAAASEFGATLVSTPLLNRSFSTPVVGEPATGVHLGVLARETSGHALRAAKERFTGLETVGLNSSEDCWQQPHENGRECCPYLVGSYDRVAQSLRQMLENGVRTFIVDTPPDEEEGLRRRRGNGPTPHLVDIAHCRHS